MTLNILHEQYRHNQRIIDSLTHQNNNIMNQILLIQVRMNTHDTIRNALSSINNSDSSIHNQPLTPNQIQTATRTLNFSNITNPINTSCPITHEQFDNTSNVTMILQCRHIFNTNSLMHWFNTHHVCPMCRFDIRNHSETPIMSEQVESNETQEQLDVSDDINGYTYFL